MGVSRNDRLGSLALEAAPDAVDVEGRARAELLEDREARLAEEGGHADALAVGLLIERERRERLAVGLRQLDHVVVEAGDVDAAVGALQGGNDRTQGVGRVVDGTAVHARVEVQSAARDVELEVDQASKSDRDRREVALEEARVRDNGEIGLQTVAICLQPRIQVDRARFLFAFEYELQVHGQGFLSRQERFRGADMHREVALAVGRTASQHAAFLHDRLERRRLPEIQRIHRLDVVVAVDEHCRLPGGVQPIGVDDRVPARLGDFDMLHADAAKVGGEVLGSRSAVGGMRRDARNARDSQRGLVRLEPLLGGAVQVCLEGFVANDGMCRRFGHWRSPAAASAAIGGLWRRL